MTLAQRKSRDLSFIMAVYPTRPGTCGLRHSAMAAESIPPEIKTETGTSDMARSRAPFSNKPHKRPAACSNVAAFGKHGAS